MQKRMNALACPVARRGSRETEKNTRERMARFMLEVWTRHKKGFGFLAARDAGTKRWFECEVQLSKREDQIWKFFDLYPRHEFDLYFCPNPFRQPVRKKNYALPTSWGWCDVDEGDVRLLDPRPSLLWETSPGRRQALWHWDEIESVEDAELYARLLSRRFGDPNGWSITKYLRIPHSINHKPAYQQPEVRLLTADWRELSVRPSCFVSMDKVGVEPSAEDLSIEEVRAVNVAEAINAYGRKVHPRVRAHMRSKRAYEGDRSKVIYEIVADLHKAGAPRREIAAVLWANPYFQSKHGSNFKKLVAEVKRITSKREG